MHKSILFSDDRKSNQLSEAIGTKKSPVRPKGASYGTRIPIFSS